MRFLAASIVAVTPHHSGSFMFLRGPAWGTWVCRFRFVSVAAIAAATPSPASAAPRSAGLVRPALKGFVARKSRWCARSSSDPRWMGGPGRRAESLSQPSPAQPMGMRPASIMS